MIKADIGRLVLCWQKGLADLYRIAASIALVTDVGPGPELLFTGIAIAAAQFTQT